MDDVLAAVKQVIEGEGLATEGVTLFYDRMPDAPDAVITVVRYTGIPGERIANQEGVAYDYPRLQITARGTDPEETYDRAQKAYVALAKYHGDKIQSLTPVSVVGLIRYDENDRPHYGTNFEALRRY